MRGFSICMRMQTCLCKRGGGGMACRRPCSPADKLHCHSPCVSTGNATHIFTVCDGLDLVSLSLPLPCLFAPGAATALFSMLQRLPQQVPAASLSLLTSLAVDCFPADPQAWCCLTALPALRQLLLPPLKPALPHEHLRSLGDITQLTSVTLSVLVRIRGRVQRVGLPVRLAGTSC